MAHNERNKVEMREKGPKVFLDYDQAALDAAYDQAAYAPNREQLIKRRIRDSELVRQRIGEPERIAYGSAEIERLDIYRVRGKLMPPGCFGRCCTRAPHRRAGFASRQGFEEGSDSTID